jgi:hypothetical protein
MLSGFRNVLRPAAFHGHGRRPPFFEGWYYKMVDREAEHALAIIPGVYFARDRRESHCFVQVFDGASGRAWYRRYAVEDFEADPNRFALRIGPNRFSIEKLSLQLEDTDLDLHGELAFGRARPWPVRIASPGVMGPFAWIPFLECYHGLLSFDHRVQGSLRLNAQPLEFDGGRGYIEKDWGSSFPSSWVWCQCNHFSRAGASLSASIAEIPNLGRSFPGFIVGLQLGEELHAFTTHHLSRVERLDADEREVRWSLRNRSHRLALTIQRARTTLLPGPTIEGMKREVHETLNAEVHVRLTRLKNGAVEFEDRGVRAGLEVQGDIEHLARRAKAP